MSRPTSRLATALLCCTRAAAIDSAHSFYRSKFGWYAADNHSHALSRPLLAATDKALYTPELDALFNDLDAIVEQHYVERHGGGRAEKVRLGAAAAATTLRAGSTARYRHQTDFYYRLGTGPWVQHVCEIGFNVGHSTAIWLASNPLLHVHSFDLFETGYKPKAVALLQRRFPGRLHTFQGDSLTVVPQTALPACDVVHIDGRHSYWNVVMDFLHMRAKSRRDAFFIFDDQCDPTNCTSTSLVPAQPTLGTCDLVTARLLEPVVSFYHSNRQFALFRRPLKEGRLEEEGRLPCAPLCRITFGSPRLRERWLGLGEGLRQERLQHKLRPQGCQFGLTEGTGKRE